ncbi:MAG: 4-alpha-glucanotransferase [Ruminococcus sp.]|nr:4-alpha-glucanotransferase [Ruminococcus sp.]
MKRSAGILLSVSSLPSKYGIGCFSEEAYRFIDFLKASGQTFWQILPLGPTGYGDSPYQSFSAFAGNPYFIDLDEFVKMGILTEKDCKECECSDKDSIDYSTLYNKRYPLLMKAYKSSHIEDSPEFRKFCEESEWLEDYALFMAVKDEFGGKSWNEWDEDIRKRQPQTLKEYSEKLSVKTGFYKFLQYHFFRQWSRLKKYAEENDIEIIGDIPIYASFDSADVWANPELFQLDKEYMPKAVAGCPPDGFSADGQLWGNPLYDWEYHKKTGFEWWIKRLAHCFKLYDVVRIDHFRGFDEYYSIPYGDKTAAGGHWEKGVGMELFSAVEKALGKKNVIAEDLGFVTDTVKQLVHDSGFPNMKVLEFGFDSRDTGSRGDYLPHNYSENCVAYTGTHDNQTITSWFETITDEERAMARKYLCDEYTPDEKLYLPFIALIMRSRANVCIVPMQDWLGLDDSSRMNTPGVVGINWKWRVKTEQLNETLCSLIFHMTENFGRINERANALETK